MHLIIICLLIVVLFFVFLCFEKYQNERYRKEIEEIKTHLFERKELDERANLQTEQYRQQLINDNLQQIVNIICDMKGSFQDVNDKFSKMFNIIGSSHGKGKMGEWGLESLLKSIRVNNGLNYLVQPDLKGGRPDFAIPVGGKYLYIDSKFPYDSYKIFQEDPSDQNFRDFISTVKKCVGDMKKYVLAEDSVGRAVLYLPLESMMLDIIEHSPETLNEFGNEGVFISSPSHLSYYLYTFVDLYSSVNWGSGLISKKRDILNCMLRFGKKMQSAEESVRKTDSLFRECERLSADIFGILNLSNNPEDNI